MEEQHSSTRTASTTPSTHTHHDSRRTSNAIVDGSSSDLSSLDSEDEDDDFQDTNLHTSTSSICPSLLSSSSSSINTLNTSLEGRTHCSSPEVPLAPLAETSIAPRAPSLVSKQTSIMPSLDTLSDISSRTSHKRTLSAFHAEETHLPVPGTVKVDTLPVCRFATSEAQTLADKQTRDQAQRTFPPMHTKQRTLAPTSSSSSNPSKSVDLPPTTMAPTRVKPKRRLRQPFGPRDSSSQGSSESIAVSTNETTHLPPDVTQDAATEEPSEIASSSTSSLPEPKPFIPIKRQSIHNSLTCNELDTDADTEQEIEKPIKQKLARDVKLLLKDSDKTSLRTNIQKSESIERKKPEKVTDEYRRSKKFDQHLINYINSHPHSKSVAWSTCGDYILIFDTEGLRNELNACGYTHQNSFKALYKQLVNYHFDKVRPDEVDKLGLATHLSSCQKAKLHVCKHETHRRDTPTQTVGTAAEKSALQPSQTTVAPQVGKKATSPIPKKQAIIAASSKSVQFDETVKTATKTCKVSEVYEANTASSGTSNKRKSTWVADWDVVSKKRVKKQETLVSISPSEQPTTPPRNRRGWHYKRKIAAQSLDSPPLKKNKDRQDCKKVLTRGKSVPTKPTIPISAARPLRSARLASNVYSGKKHMSLSPRDDKQSRFGCTAPFSTSVTPDKSDGTSIKRYPLRGSRSVAAQKKNEVEDEFGGVSEFVHFNSKIKAVIIEEDEVHGGDVEYLPHVVEDCGTSMRLLRALKRAKSPDFEIKVKQEMLEAVFDCKAPKLEEAEAKNREDETQMEIELSSPPDRSPIIPRCRAHIENKRQDSIDDTSSELSSVVSEPLPMQKEEHRQDTILDAVMAVKKATLKAGSPVFDAPRPVARQLPFNGPSTPREESIAKTARERLSASEPCLSSVAHAHSILGMNIAFTRGMPVKVNEIQAQEEETEMRIDGAAEKEEASYTMNSTREHSEGMCVSFGSILPHDNVKVPLDLIQQKIAAACSLGENTELVMNMNNLQTVPTLKIESASPSHTDSRQVDEESLTSINNGVNGSRTPCNGMDPQYLHPTSTSAFVPDQTQAALSKQDTDDDDLVDSLFNIYMPSPRSMNAGLPGIISDNVVTSPYIFQKNTGLERSDSEGSVLWSRSTAIQAESVNLKFKGKECCIIPEKEWPTSRVESHGTVGDADPEQSVLTASSPFGSSSSTTPTVTTPFDPCPATPKKWKENELLTPDGLLLQMPFLQSMTLAGIFVGTHRSSSYAMRQLHEAVITVSDDDESEDSMLIEQFISPLATLYTS